MNKIIKLKNNYPIVYKYIIWGVVETSDEITWLKDEKIAFVLYKRFLRFKTEEDAMAFKLRWI